MMKSVPMRPRLAPKATLSFAIVASEYNAHYVQPMVNHAYTELTTLEPGAAVTLISAPGSFEIPLFVKALAELERHQAIIALGVLMQGETAHAQLVAHAVTTALMTISIDHHVPILHEVLLLDNDEQAQARCLSQEYNRGIEAARAAVSAARTLRDIR